MWPKRADELLAGGSLYWVFHGLVLARQRILGLEPRRGGDGIERCAIRLDPEVVRTLPQPRRPFQGWRYLRPEDAPRDLVAGDAGGRGHAAAAGRRARRDRSALMSAAAPSSLRLSLPRLSRRAGGRGVEVQLGRARRGVLPAEHGGRPGGAAAAADRELQQDIDAAAPSRELMPARVLFQSYTNEVPVCEAHTRNAALVEINRSKPGGAPPAWTEYLVIVPEADGTSRIDDVLFATRRSDTLRARLGYFAVRAELVCGAANGPFRG